MTEPEKPEAPDVPLSYNFITKGDPEPLFCCVDSVYGALHKEGDECVIVDTCSSNRQYKKLVKGAKEFPNCRVVDARHLSVNYAKLAQKYLSPAMYKEYRKHIGNGRGILDFSEARNIALDASRNDLIFWADADDVVVEETPGQLRKLVNRIFGEDSPQRVSTLFMDYHYAFSTEDNALITQLRRERIFRKSELRWEGRCHETACPIEGTVLDRSAYFSELTPDDRSDLFAAPRFADGLASLDDDQSANPVAITPRADESHGQPVVVVPAVA